MLGKPVIRGTRVPVELILRKLGEGASEADLLDAYPWLSREDIRAAIRYAADVLAHEETILVGPADRAAAEGVRLVVDESCFTVLQPGQMRVGRRPGG